jgi:hypothetical protein
MNALTSADYDNQPASEIPTGGAVITICLWMRCKRESSVRQRLGVIMAGIRSSRPLNGYGMGRAAYEGPDKGSRKVDSEL